MIALLIGSLSGYALAQEHHGGPGHEPEHREPERRAYAPRPAPPKWQPHPAGVHPHGPMVRQHQVRILRPEVITRGQHHWHHWDHPEFSRPVYYWDWAAVHSITCTAEDSYGDQYPITQNGYAGFGLNNMSELEDEALDRCFSETNGDQSCYLASCSHF